ncbi:MAG: glycosyltransferase, partial [Bdellovibrionota bacterium]
ATTIRATLDSAIAQTHEELEILVVDNASDDDTSAIANEYADRDPRVRLLRYEKLVSAEENFIRCLELAAGKLVAILHADDIYEPQMIEEQVAFLQRHPQCEVVFTHAKIIDAEGNVVGERYRPDELRSSNVILDHGDLLKLVAKYGNFLTCPSALMRADTFGGVLGGWNGPEFASSADLDLWIRASLRGPIGFMTAPLMQYRVSEVSFSVAMQKVRTTRHPLFKVLDHHLRELSDDPEVQRNLKFLEAKDAALVCMNHMKRGEDVEARMRLSLAEYAQALLDSRYQRRFAIRMAAIGLFEKLYGLNSLKPLISAVFARVRA